MSSVRPRGPGAVCGGGQTSVPAVYRVGPDRLRSGVGGLPSVRSSASFGSHEACIPSERSGACPGSSASRGLYARTLRVFRLRRHRVPVDPIASLPPDVPAVAALERGQPPTQRRATPQPRWLDADARPGSSGHRPGLERRSTPGPGADPHGSDGRFALRVPPRVGGRHGRRPRADPADGRERAALRRRSPLEFRHLCQPRAAAGLRPQRLRRDACRTLGMGRQAPRGQLRRRLARERFPGVDLPRHGAICCSHVSPGIRRFAGMRALEVWYSSIDVEELIARAAANQRPRAPLPRRHRDLARRGAPTRPHLGARQALGPRPREGGWLIRDRPPLLHRLPEDDPGRAVIPALHRSLPALAGAGSTRAGREAPTPRRRPQGGRCRQCRDPMLYRPLRGPGRWPADPAGQGGPLVCPRAVPQARPPSQPGRARGHRPAHHAGRLRQLPGLDEVARRRTRSTTSGSSTT